MWSLWFRGLALRVHLVSPLPTDNTAGVYARRGGFSRQKQDLYLLPIVISDGGIPPMSSTNTLTIKVCGCDVNGALLSCNAEAYILNAGLSTGALIAILACIVILLGKEPPRLPVGRAFQPDAHPWNTYISQVTGNCAICHGGNLRQKRGDAWLLMYFRVWWGNRQLNKHYSRVGGGCDEQMPGITGLCNRRHLGHQQGTGFNIRDFSGEEFRQRPSIWTMVCLTRGMRRVRGRKNNRDVKDGLWRTQGTGWRLAWLKLIWAPPLDVICNIWVHASAHGEPRAAFPALACWVRCPSSAHGPIRGLLCNSRNVLTQVASTSAGPQED